MRSTHSTPRVWLALLLLLMAQVPVTAQLDTLYYDDFIDNRHGWGIWRNEQGRSEIEDGFLHMEVRQRKGRYYLRAITNEVVNPDTMVYEVAVEVENVRFVGAVYEYDRWKKKGKSGIREYRAFGVTPKSASSYSFFAPQNRIYPGWRIKDPDIFKKRMVFRLTYGHGMYHFFLNDRHLRSVRASRRATWKNWGWVVKGYAIFKIDYLLLMKG